jgi:hypothetical protein
MRMSVHVGQVRFDEGRISGDAVTHLFRMLEPSEFRSLFEESGTDFALITSETVYEEFIRHRPGLLDPGIYTPIEIRDKKTHIRSWLYLPPIPQPPLRRTGRAPLSEGGAASRSPDDTNLERR